jgi:multisubunit Na+/H+ antiporter MnhF subunit
MKIFVLNIGMLIVILAMHFIIIKTNGRNNIVIDFVLIFSIATVIIMNVYSVYSLLKKNDKFIYLALAISLIYYLLVFAFPLFSGSR